MSEDARLWALTICLGFVLALTAVSCGVYDNEVLPRKMADKGYCWARLPDAAVFAYRPCSK